MLTTYPVGARVRCLCQQCQATGRTYFGVVQRALNAGTAYVVLWDSGSLVEEPPDGITLVEEP